MLSSTFVRTKAGRFIPVVVAALFLAGCPSQAPQTPPVNIQDEANASAAYYLQQLRQSSDDNKANWQLLAIRALLREGQLPQANQQLGSLPQNLTSIQQVERQLLSAELQIANKNVGAARSALGQIDNNSLSPNQRVRFYQAQIAANQGKASLPLIRAYIAQEPLLNDKAHQDNLDKTWQVLLGLTPQDMNSLTINADENVLQGWLDLRRVYQENRQDPDMLKAGIKDWQNRYPQNPAARSLPTQLDQVLNFTQASTSNIALLLPLNGQAKVFADAIQQGFEAAKNGTIISAPVQPQPSANDPQQPSTAPLAVSDDPNADGAVSTSAPSEQPVPVAAAQSASVAVPITPPQVTNARVRVYDTASQPLPALLAQAQQDGATLVVGPLLKNNVEQLSGTSTTLNVLALNQPETPQDNPNVCYFALSPEDEARDAAHHIWEQQKRQPLLLIPRGTFGDRIAKAFAQEWQQLGGQTVLQQGIGSASELRQAVNSGGIRMAGTPVAASSSATQSVTIAGLTIPAPPSDTPATTDGSVDAVYIVATQSQLTLIKPMIDMTTNSRSKPAMYASSRSYQAGAGPDFRLEMEGLQFSDIPLLAGANSQLMQQASAKFHNDYSLVRLYAMGIDAWQLANHFSEMRRLPGFQVSGTTGMLTSSSNCVINRKLPWLQYRQGQVVPAS